MIRALALRAFLVVFLLGAYVYAWAPYGRTAATMAGAAALRRAVPDSHPQWSVQIRPEGHRLTLQSPSASRSIGWTAPAGVRFLLPALGVVLLGPRRLYWLYLWEGHLVLGALGIFFLALGVATGAFWFVLYDALTQYLVDAFSIGVAAGAVIAEYDLAPARSADASPTNGDP